MRLTGTCQTSLPVETSSKATAFEAPPYLQNGLIHTLTGELYQTEKSKKKSFCQLPHNINQLRAQKTHLMKT